MDDSLRLIAEEALDSNWVLGCVDMARENGRGRRQDGRSYIASLAGWIPDLFPR